MDSKAVRGFTWTILSYGGNRVVTVATTIVLARLLVPEDFGLFALATLGINFVSLFSGLGLGNALVVRSDLDRQGQGTILTLLIAAGILFAALLAAASPLVAEAFAQPRLDEMLAALAVVLSFTGANWFYDSLLQKELEFRRRFACQLARTVAYSVTGLSLAIAGAGAWSLIGAFAAGHLANGIALVALAPYRVRPSWDWPVARGLIRTGRGFVLQDSADFAQQNVDYAVVGRVLGTEPLGFYTLAYRQAELPHYAIADPVSRVTFPAFARMRSEGQDVAGAYLVALGMVGLAVMPLGAVLSGAARPFVETFFGDRWLPMTGVLAVLGIWAVARPLEVTVGWMLNATGHAGAVGRMALALLALLVPTVIVAATLGGVESVAWVMVGHAAVSLGVLTGLVRRQMGIGLGRQWRAILPLVASGAIAWAAARGLTSATESLPALVSLAASATGALFAYLAAVRLLVPSLLGQAWRRARRALGRPQSISG